MSQDGLKELRNTNFKIRVAMRKALKDLGYIDTYHMDSIFENPPDCDMWREAFAAKYHNKGKKFERQDWDKLLGHCQVWEVFRDNEDFRLLEFRLYAIYRRRPSSRNFSKHTQTQKSLSLNVMSRSGTIHAKKLFKQSKVQEWLSCSNFSIPTFWAACSRPWN